MAAVTHPSDDIINVNFVIVPNFLTNHCYTYGDDVHYSDNAQSRSELWLSQIQGDNLH